MSPTRAQAWLPGVDYRSPRRRNVPDREAARLTQGLAYAAPKRDLLIRSQAERKSPKHGRGDVQPLW